ncbi:uncharacterized protein V1510DRAFT_359020, partial [Dipodascopsis tothii]|uniref:uncharacterized protein n=1 Tax=Dipodascopsis tothii TaxID=44089 RepID=UPI0034CDEBA0
MGSLSPQSTPSPGHSPLHSLEVTPPREASAGHSASSTPLDGTSLGLVSDSASNGATTASPGGQSRQRPNSISGNLQRACTQCQRHKIKCINDSRTGPCVRCKKKGLLCTITPRKKRVSKKLTNTLSLPTLSANSHLGPVPAAVPVTKQATHTDAQCESASQSDTADAPYFSAYANGPTPSWLNMRGAEPLVAPRPFYSGFPIEESTAQTTIGSCEYYMVYMSLSLVCPDIFMRVVDSNKRPAGISSGYKMLRNDPVEPIFAFSFPNDMVTNRSFSSFDPSAVRRVLEWKRRYGEELTEIYFGLLNPMNPIVHRRHFMEAYRQDKESTPLLLAVFAITVGYCPSIPLKDRAVLQREFTNHFFSAFGSKIIYPSLDTVQALVLICECLNDRGVLMPHGSAVSAAIELRLHIDCSDWKIPLWERTLRKSIWRSICIRDSWIIVRFLGLPKIMKDYCDAPIPTAEELYELVVGPGRSASDVTWLALGGPKNSRSGTFDIPLESCLQSFVGIAELSDLLQEVYLMFFLKKGQKFIREHTLAAIEIANTLDIKVQQIVGGWEQRYGPEFSNEATVYCRLFASFIRLTIHSSFLYHRHSSMSVHHYTHEGYRTFFASTREFIALLEKLQGLKSGSYWPVWMNHVLFFESFILFDICIYVIGKSTLPVGSNGKKRDYMAMTGEGTQSKRDLPKFETSKALVVLLDIFNKNQFGFEVMCYCKQILSTMSLISDLSVKAKQNFRTLLWISKSFGLFDLF